MDVNITVLSLRKRSPCDSGRSPTSVTPSNIETKWWMKLSRYLKTTFMGTWPYGSLKPYGSHILWLYPHYLVSAKINKSEKFKCLHYNDVIMSTMASQITSLTIVFSIVYSGADQRKHHNSASLAFVMGIHRGQVNSPHKGPVTRKMCPFDDVIMYY